MMKNVSLFPLIVFPFLVNNWHSATRLIKVFSATGSSSTKQRLIRAFQVTAQSLNPVHINKTCIDSFLTYFLENGRLLPAFYFQQIVNNQARFCLTIEENDICQIPMNASTGAVFAKTFSLNMTSLNFVNVKNNNHQKSQ
jgi:hypothetical protein